MNTGSALRARVRAWLREAIHWFVTNDAHDDLPGAVQRGWEPWFARLENRADYGRSFGRATRSRLVPAHPRELGSRSGRR